MIAKRTSPTTDMRQAVEAARQARKERRDCLLLEATQHARTGLGWEDVYLKLDRKIAAATVRNIVWRVHRIERPS